jgi:hypothetical protein
MITITNTRDGVMTTARTMVEILYDHMDRDQHTIDLPAFGLTWRLGDHRLGDSCKDEVLTIRDFQIRRANAKRAVAAHFVRTIIRGKPIPRQKIAYLHFWTPPFNLKGVLMGQHFNPYRIGGREDFWHVVDGQGELL